MLLKMLKKLTIPQGYRLFIYIMISQQGVFRGKFAINRQIVIHTIAAKLFYKTKMTSQ